MQCLPVPSADPPLPPPSPDLAATRIFATAVMRAVGRRRSGRILQELAVLIEDEEEARSVHPIRPPQERAAQAEADRLAVNWLRQMLSVWLRALPEE